MEFDTSDRSDVDVQSEQPQLDKGQVCEDDRCATPAAAVSYCVDCDTSYCDQCWRYQAPHKAGKTGRDGFAHEKSNYQISKIYKDILHPPSSANMLRGMHEEDFDTLWFGAAKDDGGRVKFIDHGRYAALMADSPSAGGKSSTKFPQLVSFVGVTNAGKSTIINMLISRRQLATTADAPFPSPVVGSATNDKVPTSGDVHLYVDPPTFSQDYPMLYADCEGLEGGESVPYGCQTQVKGNRKKQHRNHVPEQFAGRTLPLKWAVDPQTKKREYAVTQLYPRLLYTFSDVVVFVLRNPKTFQSSVLGRLLSWGAAALEKSINQPTLPHAIIVLNATDIGVDNAEWDPKTATENLLATAANAFDKISGIPELRELVEKWRERGVEIRTVQGLIERYYSSFTVVRIPTKGRYSLMDQQALKLHETISVRCREAFASKRRARMLSNADELNVYLQAAFDHFANNLNRPFNFIEASLRNNPLPENFGDHILQLALAIRDQYQDDSKATGQWIFNNLGQMVASCIMLDCVRYRKGTSSDLFASYRTHLEDALYDFCDMSWPCGFVSRKRERCTVVRVGHTKGHQSASGKVIGDGEYQSNFEPESFSQLWMRSVQLHMDKLHMELQCRQEHSASDSELPTGLEIHRERMTSCFEKMGSATRYVSHTTCFCCLQGVPEHGLACGHVLCSSCVQAYGERTGDTTWTLRSCPLHYFEAFQQPWKVWFKPEYAGIRVLCLDGGGIRGIVELQVLRAIEDAIGCGLPIQAFFDLIVGTSTGGIIALALGVKQWPVDKCITIFKSLCDTAFTPKPMVQRMAFLHATKYKTKPLYAALTQSLGEDVLFGGRREQNPEHTIKVGVTATSGTGREALLLSNYGRVPTSSEQYQFLRLDNPSTEIRVNEAAAATSAAPTYFKEFYHKRSNRTFVDGALYFNNPAQIANTERKLLWPDVANAAPDILLSIGTGTHAATISKELKEHRMKPSQSDQKISDLLKDRLKTEDELAKKQSKGGLVKVFKILRKRFDNVLDAELAWRDFKANTSRQSWPDVGPMPYIRFNPDIGYPPPPFDAKAEVHTVGYKVTKRLEHVSAKVEVQRIAFHLIASTFYFSKQGYSRSKEEIGPQTCTGTICCRFEDNSKRLRQLGEFLRLQQGTMFSPYFKVHNQYDQDETQIIPISGDVIDCMVNRAAFSMPTINIDIWRESTSTNIALGLRSNLRLNHDEALEMPLSGFPRCFATEETEKHVRQASPESSHTILKKRRSHRRFSPRATSSDLALEKTIEETLTSTRKIPASPTAANHVTTTKSRNSSLTDTPHTSSSLRSSLYAVDSQRSPPTDVKEFASGGLVDADPAAAPEDGRVTAEERAELQRAIAEMFDSEDESRRLQVDTDRAIAESLATESEMLQLRSDKEKGSDGDREKVERPYRGRERAATTDSAELAMAIEISKRHFVK